MHRSLLSRGRLGVEKRTRKLKISHPTALKAFAPVSMITGIGRFLPDHRSCKASTRTSFLRHSSPFPCRIGKVILSISLQIAMLIKNIFCITKTETITVSVFSYFTLFSHSSIFPIASSAACSWAFFLLVPFPVPTVYWLTFTDTS